MSKVKGEQLVWLIVATIFTGGMIYFVQDSGTTSAMAAAFTGIVGIYLGLDIALMIKKTHEMAGGNFQAMDKGRYITAMVLFSLLLIEAFYISAFFKRNCDSLYTSFGLGLLIVLGGLIAGVQGNKIATNEAQEEPPAIGFGK